MQITVGSSLLYNKEECICTRIEKRESSSFAKVDSTVMQSELLASSNCRYLNMDITPFMEGDIITTECEWLELTSPGRNLFYIYKTYKVGKDQKEDANTRGDQESDKEARDHQAKDVGAGTQGGESSGEESAGEGRGAGDGDGQSGEEGVVGDSRQCERGQHAEK